VKVTTRNEMITMRAAEKLSEAFAKSQGSDNADLLLRVALMQAADEIGGEAARNPVAMTMPLKVILNGRRES